MEMLILGGLVYTQLYVICGGTQNIKGKFHGNLACTTDRLKEQTDQPQTLPQ